MITQIGCPFLHEHIDDHASFKNLILDAIELAGQEVKDDDSWIAHEKYTNITKSDYNSFGKYPPVPYNHLESRLSPILIKLCKEFSWDEYMLHNMWFQQYKKGSSHGFHTHILCQFTGVYYLEFPEGSPETELIYPFETNPTSIKVKEGDVILFPSLVRHRAPEVTSDVRKTIISFNMSFR